MAGREIIDILKRGRRPEGLFLILSQVKAAVSNYVSKWKHPSCCLRKKLRTFACQGRSLGNVTCSAFPSVKTLAVWVSCVRREGLQ